MIFAGLPNRYESEGFDRADMKMPDGQLRMIDAVAAANPNTVVVLLCGSAVECPWADRVKGILYMGLPGQAGGEAVADLLCGRANPSGKLAESWPLSYADVPSSEIYGKTDDALYQEGVYVGYRYYGKAGVPVRWPFGYGLSYTTFAYSDLTVDGNAVSVAVKNTGLLCRCRGGAAFCENTPGRPPSAHPGTERLSKNLFGTRPTPNRDIFFDGPQLCRLAGRLENPRREIHRLHRRP